jgi:type II secretory pathway pseudopilin PulG
MMGRRYLLPGTTLIELLLFIALLGVVGATTVPLLYWYTKNRVLQQTISIVEQNGAQVLQNIALRVHQAEKILVPAQGTEGTVAAFQTGSGTTNPTILGTLSGTIVIIRGTVKETLSSGQVAVQNFRIRNTSVSPTRQSTHVSFTLSKTVRLQQPFSYIQYFEGAFTLLPDTTPQGNLCGCTPPYCKGNNIYEWRVCESDGTCSTATTPLQCP